MVMYMHNVTMCTSVHVRACPCENHDIRANLHGRCTDVHGLARIFLSAPKKVTSTQNMDEKNMDEYVGVSAVQSTPVQLGNKLPAGVVRSGQET